MILLLRVVPVPIRALNKAVLRVCKYETTNLGYRKEREQQYLGVIFVGGCQFDGKDSMDREEKERKHDPSCNCAIVAVVVEIGTNGLVVVLF